MNIEAGLQGKINKKLEKTRKIFRKYVESDSDISNIFLCKNVNHK